MEAEAEVEAEVEAASRSKGVSSGSTTTRKHDDAAARRRRGSTTTTRQQRRWKLAKFACIICGKATQRHREPEFVGGAILQPYVSPSLQDPC